MAAPPRVERGVPWGALIRRVLEDPSLLRPVFQPVVSTESGEVVGYEALSRFEETPGLPPDRWFAAADQLGFGAELEALAMARCLEFWPSLPDNCFLSVNVSPHVLPDERMCRVLFGAGDLRGLVIELTEHRQAGDLPALAAMREHLAERGALFALDDAGAGYAGLQQILQFRPDFIKLDRLLVADVDQDEAKVALIESVGELASRLDAWLLAEGVETWAEIHALQRLGVPLVQGFRLGAPGEPWVQLAPGTARRLRSAARLRTLVGEVASLVEEVAGAAGQPYPGHCGWLLDEYGHPAQLMLPVPGTGGSTGSHRLAPVTLRTPPSATVVELARRVVARPAQHRFDPAVCVDQEGRGLGIVRVERLLLRLAELGASGPLDCPDAPTPAPRRDWSPPWLDHMEEFDQMEEET